MINRQDSRHTGMEFRLSVTGRFYKVFLSCVPSWSFLPKEQA